MSKTVIVGDIHGRDIWKKIIEKENGFDKLVFIGDYFDTHERINPNEMINNFNAIVTLKQLTPEKVVLLLGNHDYHYLKGVSQRYSGYNDLKCFDYQEVLEDAISKDLIKVCYTQASLLFSHAGVTKTWCKNNLIDTKSPNLQEIINDGFKADRKILGFTPGKFRNPYGDEVCQTPIWVRPTSLMQDKLDDYIQIVGHTQQKEILNEGSCWFVDTFGYSKQYLVIENYEMKVTNL